MKELHLTMQIRNNLLRQRRIAAGLSCKKLCEAVGIQPGTYFGLERLRSSPFRCPVLRKCRVPSCEKPATYCSGMLCRVHRDTRPGTFPLKRAEQQWSTAVEKLAKFYKCQPTDLFPANVLAVGQSTFTKEMDVSEVGRYLTSSIMEQRALAPDAVLEQKEIENSLRQRFKCLTPREQEVLSDNFDLVDGKDAAQGATKLVCRNRRYQLRSRALRKLRWSFGKIGEFVREGSDPHKWEKTPDACVIVIPNGPILDPPLRVPHNIAIRGREYKTGQVIRTEGQPVAETEEDAANNE